MSDTLVLSEIFLSLQGESTLAGLPCVFLRLSRCNLRCAYCDTAYAFADGREMSRTEILEAVERLAGPFGRIPAAGLSGTAPSCSETEAGTRRVAVGRLPLVELTGGEPLLQPTVLPLMTQLCDAGFTVLLETSGALDIAAVDPRVRRIMDLKCPSSGEVGRNRWDNLRHLQPTDEVKFVIGTREDYAWAREQLARHHLTERCPVLFSWVTPLLPHQRDPSLRAVPEGQTPLSRQELAERILADALPVRFQLQMHKFIWAPDRKGV
jgi:7-carboxy-7-deazaguanine synthase